MKTLKKLITISTFLVTNAMVMPIITSCNGGGDHKDDTKTISVNVWKEHYFVVGNGSGLTSVYFNLPAWQKTRIDFKLSRFLDDLSDELWVGMESAFSGDPKWILNGQEIQNGITWTGDGWTISTSQIGLKKEDELFLEFTPEFDIPNAYVYLVNKNGFCVDYWDGTNKQFVSSRDNFNMAANTKYSAQIEMEKAGDGYKYGLFTIYNSPLQEKYSFNQNDIIVKIGKNTIEKGSEGEAGKYWINDSGNAQQIVIENKLLLSTNVIKIQFSYDKPLSNAKFVFSVSENDPI